MNEHDTPNRVGDGDSITHTRDADESVTHSVVRAVAAVTGTDPFRLPPLYDTVDPEALSQVVDSLSERSPSSRTGQVSFRLDGCRVTVHADGRTVVTSPDRDDN